MDLVEIKRIASNEAGTYGVIIVNKKHLFCSLELGFNSNKKNISRIPAGTYDLRKRRTGKYANHYELLNVPSRSGIIIHSGNTKEDVRGCILIGERFYEKGVLDSIKALKRFHSLLKAAKHPICVVSNREGV